MPRTWMTLPLLITLSLNASAREIYDPFPEIRLNKRDVGGEEAIQSIGTKIDQVAKHYKMKSNDLKKLLRNDQSLRLNNRGLLYFAEDITLGEGAPFNPSPDVLPEAETFKLHSRSNPGGGMVYLSFEGTTVTNTSWNFSGPIVAAPYSHDADPAFTAAELREIRAIWLRIAEDFAPFDIDVTTERPINPPTKYTEVIFTPSSQWYGSAGGVAFIGSYTWGLNTPCWVFSSLLGNNTKNVSEAGSHEIGHTLGLYHWERYDPATGTLLSNYYGGHGNWAPIMGVGYYRGIVTWSQGDYPGSGISSGMGSSQNDMQVIAQKTGYVNDEAPSNPSASAPRLARVTDPTSGMQIQHRGIISNSNDVDVYRMDTLGGSIHLSVDPAIVSSNLDFRVRLYNSNGTVLQESDPFEVASAHIDMTSSDPGTYYFEVKPMGSGDWMAGGYSSYGSAGQYHVTGTYAPASNDTWNPTPFPTATPQPTPTPIPTPSPTPAPNPSPVVEITSPVFDAQIKRNSNFKITVSASDNSKVKKLVVMKGSQSVCSKNLNAASVNITCSTKAPSTVGPLDLTAIATDDLGKQTVSPIVTIQITN